MPEIEDPWNSRPIDVHKWSDHPEVVQFADRVWDEYLPEEVLGGRGPKPKLAFRKQLRVLILDLYVAWLEDPEMSIGVSMSVNAWKTNSRYNALHLSKKMVTIIQALHDEGLIDMAKGSYTAPGSKGNRTTRIRASETLQGWFSEAKFEREDITQAEGQEVIVLKDDANKLVEYTDTPETTLMRRDLDAYNTLLRASFIDIPTQDDPVISILDEDTQKQRIIRLGGGTPLTRRIFSRNSWQMNGRFYGGWWQRIDEDWRAKIFINDKPTVEVDFQGLHIKMIYALQGEAFEGDPYDISSKKFGWLPLSLLRTLTKRLTLTAINAKDKSSAYLAFRDGLHAIYFARTASNDELDKFLEAFLSRNPKLEDYLFTDKGIELMRLDGEITSLIHNHFTEQGIPVLSVHDSYIVEASHVTEMQKVMAKASKAVVGMPLSTSIKLADIAEGESVSDQAIQDHIFGRKVERSQGYLDRLARFEARKVNG